MIYFGGKGLIGRRIADVLKRVIGLKQAYYEPFCGSCSVLCHMDGERYGYDLNKYIIGFWNAYLYHGWKFPRKASKWLYSELKKNPDKYDPALVALYGHGLSIKGMFFGSFWGGLGYTSLKRYYDPPRVRVYDRLRSAKVSSAKKRPGLMGAILEISDYRNIIFKPNSFIYCDPPYIGTVAPYESESFDHDEFWLWCEDLKAKGHTVVVSEISGPLEHEIIAEFKRPNRRIKWGDPLIVNKHTDKLFLIK